MKKIYGYLATLSAIALYIVTCSAEIDKITPNQTILYSVLFAASFIICYRLHKRTKRNKIVAKERVINLYPSSYKCTKEEGLIYKRKIT